MTKIKDSHKVRTFCAGGYEAVIASAIGGNLIALRKGEFDILRHYEDLGDVEKLPIVYGLPVLFPPNRIDGGSFTFEGKTYQFPIVEKERGNSLHGFLFNRPWDMRIIKESKEEAVVCLTFKSCKDADYYLYYPHEFTIDLTYTLNTKGLQQSIKITNLGNENMPFGLGWHSAFALDFKKGVDPKNVRIRVSIGKRIELDDRMLPTGVVSSLSIEEEKFRSQNGQSPVYAVMDDHFTAEPIIKDGKMFHGAILEDYTQGVRVVYEVDESYEHWMIWNGAQEESLICIEPQNWRVNAPNLDISTSESGMQYIKPNGIYQAEASIYVEEDKNL